MNREQRELGLKIALFGGLALNIILFIAMVMATQMTGGGLVLHCATPRNQAIQLLRLALNFTCLGMIGYFGYYVAFESDDAKWWQRTAVTMIALSPGLIFIESALNNSCVVLLLARP